MKGVSKSSVLHCLENDWAEYVGRFGSLPQEEKGKFLKRQGFACFSDLLSHIVAWWEEAAANIQAVRENPGFKSPKYDVDKFNLEAVRKTRGMDEKEIIRKFEEKRKQLLKLVATLGDSQIKEREMQTQLYWMIANHYHEHKI